MLRNGLNWFQNQKKVKVLMTKIEKESGVVTTVTLNKEGPAVALDLPGEMAKAFGEIKVRLLRGKLTMIEIMKPRPLAFLDTREQRIEMEKRENRHKFYEKIKEKEEVSIEIEEQGKKINTVLSNKYIHGMFNDSISGKRAQIGGNNLEWPTFLSIKEASFDEEGKVIWVTLYVCIDFYYEKETGIDRLKNKAKRVPDKPDKLISFREVLERKVPAG